MRRQAHWTRHSLFGSAADLPHTMSFHLQNNSYMSVYVSDCHARIPTKTSQSSPNHIVRFPKTPLLHDLHKNCSQEIRLLNNSYMSVYVSDCHARIPTKTSQSSPNHIVRFQRNGAIQN